LNDVWGVRKVKLNPKNGEPVISFDEDTASFMDFEQAVKDCGYNLLSADQYASNEEDLFIWQEYVKSAAAGMKLKKKSIALIFWMCVLIVSMTKSIL
jgi:hypothetical protein